MSELTIEDLKGETYQMDHIIERQLIEHICEKEEKTNKVLIIFDNEFNLRILKNEDNIDKRKSVTRFINNNNYTDEYIAKMKKLYKNTVRPQVYQCMEKERHKTILTKLDKLMEWKKSDTEDHIIDEQMINDVCKKCEYNEEKIKEVLKIFGNEFNLRSLNSEDIKSKGESVTRFISNNNYTDEYIAEMKKLYKNTVRPEALPDMVNKYDDFLSKLDRLLELAKEDVNDHIIDKTIINYVCEECDHKEDISTQVWHIINKGFNLRVLRSEDISSKETSVDEFINNNNYTHEYITKIKKLYRNIVRPGVFPYMENKYKKVLARLDSLLDWKNCYPNSDSCKIDYIIEEQIISHVYKESGYNVEEARSLFNNENNLQILTITEIEKKTLAIANWLNEENLSDEDKEWIALIKKSYKYNIRSKVEGLSKDFKDELDNLMYYTEVENITEKVEKLSRR